MAWVRETQDKMGLQRASPPPVLFHGREHRSCSSLLKVTDISATSSTARSRAEGSGPLPPPLLLRLTSPHLSLSRDLKNPTESPVTFRSEETQA